MGAIFRREFKSYMTNMYGIVFVFFILVFAGVFFFMYNLMYMIPQFEYSMIDIQMILIIAVPVLAMRSMAEDRHNGTDRFLLSLPLKMSGIVMGKYFAMLAVFALPVAVMCTFPLILSLFGEVYFLTTYSSIFAFFLLGAFLLAICMYISSLTDNRICRICIYINTGGKVKIYPVTFQFPCNLIRLLTQKIFAFFNYKYYCWFFTCHS